MANYLWPGPETLPRIARLVAARDVHSTVAGTKAVDVGVTGATGASVARRIDTPGENQEQAMFFARTLYVDVDPQSLREAEQWAERELLAASGIVRHARRDHSEFWRRVDARMFGGGQTAGASA
jgi:hypothetical protein